MDLTARLAERLLLSQGLWFAETDNYQFLHSHHFNLSVFFQVKLKVMSQYCQTL